MGEVAAYFDLDGTLLDASSEKTLTQRMARVRPLGIPLSAVAWGLRLVIGLISGRSLYDAARNRGHFTSVRWADLERESVHLVEQTLTQRVPKEAWERLAWHRERGHHLVLVTATVAPMAEAMGEALGMDRVYGCGPPERIGRLSGSERGWSVPRRKGKAPIVEADASEHGHALEACWGYGNTHADSWFMRLCGHPVAVNAEASLDRLATKEGWDRVIWRCAET